MLTRSAKQRSRSDNGFAKHEMRSADLLDERTSMTYNLCWSSFLFRFMRELIWEDNF